jgi:hypothetical protein
LSERKTVTLLFNLLIFSKSTFVLKYSSTCFVAGQKIHFSQSSSKLLYAGATKTIFEFFILFSNTKCKASKPQRECPTTFPHSEKSLEYAYK